MKLSHILFIILSINFSSTNSTAQHTHNSKSHDHSNSITTKSQKGDIDQNKKTIFSTALSGTIEMYLNLKNSLVNDDSKKAKLYANKLIVELNKIEFKRTNKINITEYNEIIEDTNEQLEHISENGLEHQREHFEVLSVDILDLIKLIGTDKTIYKDYCPMANNGNGAIWLSDVKVIKNPYFGSKMLSCGTIKETISN